MPTWDSTFNTSPPETEDHGRGGERIRDTRDAIRLRFTPEHNVGDASTVAGYTDDGRHNPGSARIFVDDNKPTTLRNFDNTAPATMPSGSSTLGSSDKGRVWIDQGGGPGIMRWYDTAPSPNRWRAVNGYNNAILNGGFQVWQRNSTGTISCPVVTNTFTADRWFVNPTGVGPYTVQRAASTFSAPTYSRYAIQINGGVALTAVLLGTRIEAADVTRLRIDTGFLNFSFRLSNTTGVTVTPTVRVSTANGGGGENDFTALTTPVTVGVAPTTMANGAQGYMTVSFNSSAFVADKGMEVSVEFAGAMAAGNLLVSEMILEWGKDRSIFVEPQFTDELRRCQRYYEKTFDYSVTPANNAGAAGALTGHRAGSNNPGRAVMMNWQFKAEKAKTTYTLAYFNPTTGTAGAFQNLSDNTDFVVLPTNIAVPGALDTRGFGRVTITNNTGPSGGTHDDDIIGIHVTCDAELI